VLPTPKTPNVGLAASKYAEEIDPDTAASPSAEKEAAEGEHDSSSAALASVRKPSPNLPSLIFSETHLL
jgi:hypothetical protein